MDITYTYFIRALSGGGHIKIGRTTDLDVRLKSLQCSNPHELVLLGYLEKDVESILHRKFSEHKVRGEWFSPHPDILSYIKENCVVSSQFQREIYDIRTGEKILSPNERLYIDNLYEKLTGSSIPQVDKTRSSYKRKSK